MIAKENMRIFKANCIDVLDMITEAKSVEASTIKTAESIIKQNRALIECKQENTTILNIKTALTLSLEPHILNNELATMYKAGRIIALAEIILNLLDNYQTGYDD